MKPEELYAKLAECTAADKKQFLFAALFNRFLLEKGIESPILVGGNALSLYTSGGYASSDLDYVSHERDKISVILVSDLGFKRLGKDFINHQHQLFVEIVSEKLAGSEDRTVSFLLEENLSIRVIGLEDLIVDRLNSCVFWNHKLDCDWVMFLVRKYKALLDLEYVAKRCAQEKTLTALNQLLGDSDV